MVDNQARPHIRRGQGSYTGRHSYSIYPMRRFSLGFTPESSSLHPPAQGMTKAFIHLSCFDPNLKSIRPYVTEPFHVLERCRGRGLEGPSTARQHLGGSSVWGEYHHAGKGQRRHPAFLSPYPSLHQTLSLKFISEPESELTVKSSRYSLPHHPNQQCRPRGCR